jgi:predicted TIM-barrel fold metal-dependent hydrolase
MVGNGDDINNLDNDVFFNPKSDNIWMTKTAYAMLEDNLRKQGADLNGDKTISTFEFTELLYKLFTESKELNGIALLAMDAVYNDDGLIDLEETYIIVSNRYLDNLVKKLNQRLKNDGYKDKRFYLGASVNPKRKDCLDELKYVIEQTDAVLLKIIPSAQHIKLMDIRHKPFFNMMAKAKLPLLSHVGPEYIFPEGINRKELDNYKFLQNPLSCGVTVIAAHCCAPVFPIYDKDHIKEFSEFMRTVNADGRIRIYTDTSGLSFSTRIPYIPEIIRLLDQRWVLFGTDFPVPIDTWQHLPFITYHMDITEYDKIINTKNPFDRDVLIKRAHGFGDSILDNTVKALRL